ncbi:hypothetical protein [Brevundimonas sp. Root1279]|uniref:hypothetical protein n=1 Tax=Brevundimonas sp. Root1279 TaxID=1736443 RepID=UPI0006FC1EC2|nr:hypothetical protein [Brevundimonas sp. Root1279]KQW82241.1 hypothetical protein ASC65_08165 [Brevundimonas sp. Root1279]
MLAILLAAGLVAAPQAAVEPRAPALTNAEACLREKADAAVAAATSASDAADFLLTYLCAGPVDRAATWQRNSEMLVSMKGMFDGLKEMGPPYSDDEESDEEAASDEAPEEADGAVMNDFFGGMENISVDPVTGEFIVPEDASNVMASTLRTQTNAVGQLLGDQRPVFLRELAGQLVLQARTRR